MAEAVASAPPESTSDPGDEGGGTPSTTNRTSVNWPVFLGTSVVIVAFVAWAAIWPDEGG